MSRIRNGRWAGYTGGQASRSVTRIEWRAVTRSFVSTGPAGSGDAPEGLSLVHVPVAAVPLPPMAEEAGLTRGLGMMTERLIG
jgi:hypothetical protein